MMELELVPALSRISKDQGSPEDRKILENSVPQLMEMYGATLSSNDTRIFSILKLCAGKKLRIELESMPLFGPKRFDSKKTNRTNANPLYAHSVRANAVLTCLSDAKAFETGMQFKDVFLNPKRDQDLEQFYDIRFLLPLVCHVLDEKNICNVLKVFTHGWIYIIARGLSLTDDTLRSTSFLAFKRLILNLQLAKGFRMQDVKIWLHFLVAVKNGFIDLENLRLTPLLSTWMIATCQVLNQPSHPLYSKVTHFLLAKPKIDLTILPEFTSFFNAEDGNRESRDWIMNILLLGLQTECDWIIAKKVPTIKYLCSIFSLEKIQMQRIILNILAKGSEIPKVAHDLVDRHGLLLWIANIKIDDRSYFKRELEDVYRNLSLSCPYGQHRECMFEFVAKKHNWRYLRDPSKLHQRSEEAEEDADIDMTEA